MSEHDESTGTGALPRGALIIAIIGSALLMLDIMTQQFGACLSASLTALSEGGMAMLIVAAGGGYGYPILRRIAPSAPMGLKVTTAAGLGLYLMALAVLLVGSFTHGLLKGWLWWPVVGIGLLLAAWQGRAKMEQWHMPKRFDGRALIWVVVAVMVGIILAGATMPYIKGTSDEYDVLEYHLQLPREYFINQHIEPLTHNVYSHYPLGVEMLYLLAFCLRNGPYEGIYLAKMLHVAFGALAVAAIYLSLRNEQEHRSYFAVGLLASTPMIIYLCWLAMVELAEVCYMAMAIMWLRLWMRDRTPGTAIIIGAMIGCACGVKYLSAGFIAAPLAVVMLAYAVRSVRLLGQVALAAAVGMVLFSPWLVRNALATGNPIFPLASQQLGRGYWSDQEQRRWIAGHSPEFQPPVPVPADWKEPVYPTRVQLFLSNFIFSQWFGPISKLLAVLAICAFFASTRKVAFWDWSLVAIFVMQLGLWAGITQGMPERFISPVLVPIALLGSWLLAQLAGIQTNPFRPNAPRAAFGPWGLKLSIILFIATITINVLATYPIYVKSTGQISIQGFDGEFIAHNVAPWKQAYDLPTNSRLLVIGNAAIFYYPPKTCYATAFDPQLLDEMIASGMSGPEIIEALRKRGITHLQFDWFEMLRLANTYGFPSSLSSESLQRLRQGRRPSLEIIRRLEASGMRKVCDIRMSEPATASAPSSAPASKPATTSAPATASSKVAETIWPIATLYELPEEKVKR